MRLLFVDGSGTPDPAADMFALGGLAIAEERYHKLRQRWSWVALRCG